MSVISVSWCSLGKILGHSGTSEQPPHTGVVNVLYCSAEYQGMSNEPGTADVGRVNTGGAEIDGFRGLLIAFRSRSYVVAPCLVAVAVFDPVAYS